MLPFALRFWAGPESQQSANRLTQPVGRRGTPSSGGMNVLSSGVVPRFHLRLART